MDLATVTAIAGQELKMNVRSKWIALFAGVFALLALAIAYFGLVTVGLIGFQTFTRTAASLLNLALYLIPIVSLSMATLSLTGERGEAELLFSQPVTRREILVARLLGLFLSMSTASLFGFGLAGVVIAVRMGTPGLGRYLSFVGLALLLALVFLCLGALAAVVGRTRARALALSLFVWFFFVLLYDLLVIGLAFVFRERTANLFIFLSLFGNPVDMVRVASLIALGDAAIFGAAGAALIKFLGGELAANAALLAALMLWVAAPLLIADRVLERLDI